MARLLPGVVEVELGCSKSTHDGVKDSELSGREGSNHDTTGDKSDSAELPETNLASNVGKTGHHGTVTSGTSLVHLGEQSVGGVRDDGGGNSSNHTRQEGDSNVDIARELIRCLAHGAVEGVGGRSLHGEFGHGVGDLLGKDGGETGVETNESLGSGHLDESISEAGGEGGVGHGADAHGLERAEEDICDKLGSGGGSEVNGGLVVPGLFLSERLGEVDLDELDSSELEPTLDEVTKGGGTKTGCEGHGSLLGNDLTESADEALVVLFVVVVVIVERGGVRVGQGREELCECNEMNVCNDAQRQSEGQERRRERKRH